MTCAVLIITKQVEGTTLFGTSTVIHEFHSDATADIAIAAAEQQVRIINTSVGWKRTAIEFVKLYDVEQQKKFDAVHDAHMNQYHKSALAGFKPDQSEKTN